LAPNFPALVIIYGAFGVGEGLYYGCLSSIACQVAGSADLSNLAIGYYHTFIAFSLNLGALRADDVYFSIRFIFFPLLSFKGQLLQLSFLISMETTHTPIISADAWHSLAVSFSSYIQMVSS
jgi:hypothetical protein